MKPTDAVVSQALPAGSAGLSINNMVRALRALGTEPKLFMGQFDLQQTSQPVQWPAPIRPADVIQRYIDSGIPVIIGLRPWKADQTSGHAILAIGHTLKKIDPAVSLPAKPTKAEFCNTFIAHDDQIGPNSSGLRRVPRVGPSVVR